MSIFVNNATKSETPMKTALFRNVSGKMIHAFFFLLPVTFFASCADAHSPLICTSRWRMVKEVSATEDDKGTDTREKLKDFSLMDRLYFNNAHQLTTVSYGDSSRYSYALKDSILTFWPADQKNKTTEYRVLVSTKDSLVLRRTEIWGTESTLKITATLHLAADR